MDQLALRLELAEALAMHDLSREHYVDYWNQCHHRVQEIQNVHHMQAQEKLILMNWKIFQQALFYTFFCQEARRELDLYKAFYSIQCWQVHGIVTAFCDPTCNDFRSKWHKHDVLCDTGLHELVLDTSSGKNQSRLDRLLGW